MIVGVHVAAQPPGRQGGDDLVGVHVGRRAGAGLEHVDREVLIVGARGDLIGGGGDRLGSLGVQHPEPTVDPGRRGLQQTERPDLGALQAPAGDREVLHGSLRLRPVKGVGGNPHLAHRVVFDPVVLFSHAESVPPEGTRGQRGPPHPPVQLWSGAREMSSLDR